IRCRGHGDSASSESIDDNLQQRVVAAILLAEDELREKCSQCAKIGNERQPAESAEQQLVLVNLSCQCRLSHAMALKVPNVRPHPSWTARQKAVADSAQGGIGMILQSDAVNFTALRLQRLGDDDGKPSPAGDKADFSSGCHAASFRSA